MGFDLGVGPVHPETGAELSLPARTRLGGVPNRVRSAIVPLRLRGLCLTWGSANGLCTLSGAGIPGAAERRVSFLLKTLGLREEGLWKPGAEVSIPLPTPPSSCPLLLVCWGAASDWARMGKLGRDGEAE